MTALSAAQAAQVRGGAHCTLDTVLADVRDLVECESPSGDHAALNESARRVVTLVERRLGCTPEILLDGGVPHVRLAFGERPTRLVLGHHDTVWPRGTLAAMPFRLDGGLARGPGIFDMKAGIVLAVHAMRRARECSPGALDDMVMLITGDEETGSSTSRSLIEVEASGCATTYVLEPGLGEDLKTERKGAAFYDIHVTGRAAHAGLEPEVGVNAATELAHLILATGSWSDPAQGTTVTPTVAHAGTTTNTVPAEATLRVDVRAHTAAEQHRVDALIHALTATVPGARIRVDGRINRPPLDALSSREPLRRARQVARALAIREPDGVRVGGASDGNFTAAMGSRTLDGLGAVGGGAHAADEHIRIDQLVPRLQLLTGLFLSGQDVGGRDTGD